MEDLYNSITRRKHLLLLLFSGIVVFLFLLDISTGCSDVSFFDVISIVWPLSHSSFLVSRAIVWQVRMPMALAALAVGSALSIAGAEMQIILDNPLASPFTLGVSGGAGFGAALAIVLGVSLVPQMSSLFVPINAFFFAMLTCFVIYSLGKIRGVSAETMVLGGIALVFLFNSLVGLLKYFSSVEELRELTFWLFGSLLKVNWPEIGIIAGVSAVVFPLFLKDSWKLTALRLGDEGAKSLGVDVERLRIKGLVMVSSIASIAVCFVGIIGFIGLAGPHIARMLVGEEHRIFLPMSALTGAALLSASDIASRVISTGAIFPIGIITSFVGVPFFILLILWKRRGYW